MRLLTLALFSVAMLHGQVPAHTNHYPHTKTGIYVLGAEGFLPCASIPLVHQWYSRVFDGVFGGGGNVSRCNNTDAGDLHGGNLTSTYWAGYTDLAVGELKFVYGIQSYLAGLGADYEGALLHSDIDLAQRQGTPNVNIGRFDVFEETIGGNFVQGVFTSVSGTFADVTNDVIAGSPVTISDTAYFGYQVPFDQINFTVTVPSGKTVAFNYWSSGSGGCNCWTPYTSHFSDGTAGLTTSGKVAFYPDTHWTARALTVNVSTPVAITTTHSKYWLQVVVTGAGASPVITSALTEDWSTTTSYSVAANTTVNVTNGTTTVNEVGLALDYRGFIPGSTVYFNGDTAHIYTIATSSQYSFTLTAPFAQATITGGTVSAVNNSRGWSSTDSNRINIGTAAEYNPTPPASASAKFKYQSRVPGTANAENYIFWNPSNVQAGHRSAAFALAYLIDVQGENFDAAFFDDGSRYPGSSGAPLIGPADYLNHLDFAQGSGSDNGFVAEQANLFSDTSSLLKAEHGSNYWMGSNNPMPGVPGQASVGDFAFLEGFVTPNPLSWCDYVATTGGGGEANCPYDWSISGTANPANTQFFWQANDHWSYQFPWFGGGIWANWHYEDNGNRTPMTTLAQHYLGWNPNAGLMYFGSNGSLGFFYTDTDQVYTYGQQLTTTTSIAQDTSSSAKTITLSGSGGCTAAFQAGNNMFRFGTKTSGDTVGGLLGFVYDWGGGDQTGLTRQGDILSNGGASPTNYYAGDVQKFGSLDITMGAASDGGPVAFQYTKNDGTWGTLTVVDGTNNLTQNGRVTWTIPSDWGTTTTLINDGYPYNITAASGYYVRIQTYNGPHAYPYWSFKTLFSGEWKTLRLPASPNSNFYTSHSSGESVYCINVQHQSSIPVPSADNVYAYGRWFTAMGTDLGIPDTAGVSGGMRMVDGDVVSGVSTGAAWKTGAQISAQPSCPGTGPQCAPLWRRDFTKGIVFHRPWSTPGSTHPIIESEIDTFSTPVCIDGGNVPPCAGRTFYPLKSDGTTGPGTQTISLRSPEGAVMMLAPAATRSRFSGTFSGTFR